MRVAIFTVPGDDHAHAVKWGLEQKGVSADLIFLGDIPQRNLLNFTLGCGQGIVIDGPGGIIDVDSYDRYWLRRPSAMVPNPSIHPTDLEAARRDWREVQDALIERLSLMESFCINPGRAYRTGHLKMLHLDVAVRSGFKVPETIIGNDKAKIREFIAANSAKGAGTIVKGFKNTAWRTASGSAAFSTIEISEADLNRSDVASAPCIFQRRVEKLCDVRLTVFGRDYMACRISSQERDSTRLDYRLVGDWSTLECAPISVPANVMTSIERFQDCLGYNFGTMDFVIDQGGEWVFLETNTTGNFLWVEAQCEELSLLDAFCEFLIAGTDEFRYAPASDNLIRISEFDAAHRGEMRSRLEHEVRSHIQRATAFLVE